MGMKLNSKVPYVTFGSQGQNSGGFLRPDNGGVRPRENDESDGKNEEKAQQSNVKLPSGGSGATILTSGAEVSIKDSDGNILYSDTAVCNASYVFFADAELDENVEYQLYSNGKIVAGSSDGESSSSCDHICHRNKAIAQFFWKLICTVYKFLEYAKRAPAVSHIIDEMIFGITFRKTVYD